MRHLTMWLAPALLLCGCSPAADRRDESKTGDTTAAAAPAPAGPAAIVTVLYNPPKDTAAFEKYYSATHLPLLMANRNAIGFVRTDFTRFSSTVDGKKPPFYRQAELYFKSMDDLKRGTASAEFKKVAGDLANFASGGVTALIATASNSHGTGSSGEPAAIVTVIYKTPKDTAAFERYYADTHLPLLNQNKTEIGFDRAEFTKFDSNLDGSAASRYRQAELYFPSMAALKKGTATAGFKKVAGDLSKFATGGFDALIGTETK